MAVSDPFTVSIDLSSARSVTESRSTSLEKRNAEEPSQSHTCHHVAERRQAKLADVNVVEKGVGWQKDTDKRLLTKKGRGPNDPRANESTFTFACTCTGSVWAAPTHWSRTTTEPRGAQLSFKQVGLLLLMIAHFRGSRAQDLTASHSCPTFLFYYIVRFQTSVRAHILNFKYWL